MYGRRFNVADAFVDVDFNSDVDVDDDDVVYCEGMAVSVYVNAAGGELSSKTIRESLLSTTSLYPITNICKHIILYIYWKFLSVIY